MSADLPQHRLRFGERLIMESLNLHKFVSPTCSSFLFLFFGGGVGAGGRGGGRGAGDCLTSHECTWCISGIDLP